MNLLTHTTQSLQAALDQLDAELRRWALAQGCLEERYPVLMDAETLQRAGYHEAFPHLLMSAAVARNPGETLDDENVSPIAQCLSPAVCYHAYAQREGCTFDPGVILTAHGHCFRNEEAVELVAGRRQLEFQMREVILIGSAAWIEERLSTLKPGVEQLAYSYGLRGEWCPANDPFFLPRGGKARMQKLLGTKLEYCLPDGLAIASINRHGTFFGDRFSLRDRTGAPAHSACVAFGLDRWTSCTEDL